ncbi:MAG: diguanylate cyclase, partial [Cyanobacteria bacterium P01_A01_bin.137]
MSRNDLTTAELYEELSTALDALPAAFVVYDKDERIIICNSSYRQEYRPFEHAVSPGVTHTDLQWLKAREGLDAAATGREEAFVADEQKRHRAGPAREEWQDDHGRYMRMHRARLPSGSVVGMRFDVTDLRAAENELRAQNAELRLARSKLARQANTDELTGLLNRRALQLSLTSKAHILAQSKDVFILMMIDLDGFKQVNDIYGHETGDLVLQEAAKRLQSHVPNGCVVARLGGDEFVVTSMMAPTVAENTAQHLAETLVDALGEPYLANGRQCRIGASIGLAFEAGARGTPARLSRYADFALQQAKNAGRSRCVVFDDEMRQELRQHEAVAQELMTDTINDELTFHLQP